MKAWLLGMAVVFGGCCCAEADWYRGNLHAHSVWSDGNVLPEDAVTWYRDNGYQFLCLSDHQALQIDPDAWVEIGSARLDRAVAARYIANHPASAEVKKSGGKEYLHLKTIWELKKQFDQPEAFLLIPGHELNRVIAGLQVHMNAVNVGDTIPYRYGATPAETFQRIENAVRFWGEERGVSTLFVLNHPTWPYYDISPDVLIGLPQIRFFEVCNADAGPQFPSRADWYSTDKFWDAVNAFRIADGYAPVFGLASDDTHNYTDAQRGARPGQGWICVQAARLEPDSLVQAMNRGDFYASTGVALGEASFDAATATLKVRVQPENGVRYSIRFVVTQAGFDRTVEPFDDLARDKKPARRGVRYADGIGATAKTSDELTASYTLAPNDLYVRAVVVSSKRIVNRECNAPEFATAWTQPVGWRLWQARNPEKARLSPAKQ